MVGSELGLMLLVVNLLYMLSSQWCYVYVAYIACWTFTDEYVYMMSEL